MKDLIALALIKRLVAVGELDADDVAAIVAELPERERQLVTGAWVEGACDMRPSLQVINGGKSAP